MNPEKMITVKICQADVPNKNNRVYPASVLETVAQSQKPILGTVGIPEGWEIPLDQISHQVTNLRIEDGYLVGNVTILETEAGKAAEALLSSASPDFRMRGTGLVSKDGVISDYELISIDLVMNGS